MFLNLIGVSLLLINIIYTKSQLSFALNKINNHTKEELIERMLYASQLNYLGLNNTMNIQYNANIKIGSNNKIYSLQIDTGSGWMWVSNVGQLGDQFATNSFSCPNSTSCSSTSHQIPISYGSGLALGTLAFDTVDLGNGYSVKNQPFLLITNAYLSGFHGDGLLGLGSSEQSQGIPTFIDMLKAQQVIQERSFSIYLTNNPNATDTNSRLIIGGYDTKYMLNNTFIYLNVIDSYYWAVGLVAASFGDVRISISSKEAIIDSGTSLIVVSYADWPVFLKSLQNIDSTCGIFNGSIICNCTEGTSALNRYPSLNFTLGDKNSNYLFSIPTSDYMMWYQGYCIPLIQTIKGSNIWVLGDLFMINYYTYFNADNNTIGFAAVNPNIDDKKSQSIGLFSKRLYFSIILCFTTIIYIYICIYNHKILKERMVLFIHVYINPPFKFYSIT